MKDERNEKDRLRGTDHKGFTSGAKAAADNLGMHRGEKDGLDKLGDDLDRAGKRAEEGLHKTGDKLKQKADNLADRTRDAVSRAGDKLERGVDRMRDKTGDALERGGDKIERTGERIKDANWGYDDRDDSRKP